MCECAGACVSVGGVAGGGLLSLFRVHPADLVKRLLQGQQQEDEMQNELTEEDIRSIVLRSAG